MNKFLFNTLPKGRQYLYSISIIVVVAAICYAFSGLMGYRVAAFILLITVSLLAVTFDILPVLLSAALSALLWDFFFIPPRYAIHVETTEDTILLIMYFVIAIISGVLTYKIRQVEKITRLKEERANSVKLYNTILNSLSHELRTPIATIIAATDNLQSNNNLSTNDRNQLVTEISNASLRLNQQVENLLNISRLESGHIKPKNDWTDIIELVYDVVKRVEENNPARKIAISINPDMPLCAIDKGMLDQIIYNLLNNAAIHTAPECSIAITIIQHVDILQIEIEDNGAGFNNVNSKEVFHKFSRTKNPTTSGSGLGLTIVKGFTEALGGNIELVSSRQTGSKFTVTLPVRTYQHETRLQ
ncbi:sensor histidine kinase [Flavihumibacter sp.]|uniref:sensor histidine kinase n=1 Tax=Flavihumibacter sp. TaxID=1913981 RepID=UPI002FC71250